MKAAALILSASAALVGAQIIIDDGKIKCPTPFGAYCVGNSLETDIIARCDENGVGHPGRCSNNLAGQPPVGNIVSLCYQTSDVAGDAACEKNCVVYGASGNGNGTYTLPTELCVPVYTSSTSSGPIYSPTSVDTSSTTPCTGVTPPGAPTDVPTPEPVPTVAPLPPLPSSDTWAPLPPSDTPAPLPATDTWVPLPPVVTPPTTTAGLPTVPTAAAPVVKQAGVAMAACGMIIACLL